MNREVRVFLTAMSLLAMGSSGRLGIAQQPAIGATPTKLEFAQGDAIVLPRSNVATSEWLAELRNWREQERATTHYDDSIYRRNATKWTQQSFVQTLMMVEDRYFYDPVAGRYTVDRYLDDLEKRYGGIDSVIVWAVYPNIGIDNRNQHDMLRDLPGGLPGVKKMVDDFHRRGVRVLFPVMPWDTGTRPEGAPAPMAAIRDIAAVGGDGIFGDTMVGMGTEVRKLLDDSGHPLVLEPELEPPDSSFVASNEMSWCNNWAPIVMPLSKYKWFESRHMIHMGQRWPTDRTKFLQGTFFNGTGYLSWENIWGIWNQLTPRDAEALRRISAIERAVADLLVSPDWEPGVQTIESDVAASKFPGAGQTVWLLVNRGARDAAGDQLRVPTKPATRYFDLWHGVELKPTIDGKNATLAFEMEARGYGAVLAVEHGGLPEKLQSLMKRSAEWSKVRLGSLSSQWKVLPQQIVPSELTKQRSKPAKEAPEGMVLIPAGKYRFQVAGVEIEGRHMVEGIDVQYPWEPAPTAKHDKELDIAAFYIDKYPVTNAQYKKFLDASGYRPKDGHNFLRDWKDGTYPQGWQRKPVTWVSIEDARAYCAWAGKRLPHEWQWQYAAQGTDGRPYPWGKEAKADAMPKPEEGPELRGPTDVDAYPQGASPFGVMDMMGNVWQWTDEYVDEHTRAAIVRGGGYYRPKGSMWYFPRNTRLDEHGKYLLMAPSKDRSGTLGFRCVVDVESQAAH